MTCFWTSLVGCEQVCSPEGERADSFFIIASGDELLPRELNSDELGITVPTYGEIQIINLFELPNAAYTLATTNKCGDSLALDLTWGVLSASEGQTLGVCPITSPAFAINIKASEFPFPPGEESLYSGILFSGYGRGKSTPSQPGATPNVSLAIDDSVTSEYVSISYANIENDDTQEGEYLSNTDIAGDVAEKILSNEGLDLYFRGYGPFQISTDFRMIIPPPAPTRWYAIIEKRWPIADNDGIDNYQFPSTEGESDGATVVRIKQDAEGPLWYRPYPLINGLVFDYRDTRELDSNYVYKLGVYAGEDGYQNMARIASMKVWNYQWEAPQ